MLRSRGRAPSSSHSSSLRQSKGPREEGGADTGEESLLVRLRRLVNLANETQNKVFHELFRKYVTYAKQNIHPKLTPAAAKVCLISMK